MTAFRQVKCFVFDLDETLWLPCKSYEQNVKSTMVLANRLMALKAKHHLFLGVASFNHQAVQTVSKFFPDGLFDVVVSCPSDCHYDKMPLLQAIRKRFRATQPHRKLKWDEIVFFDDMVEVLANVQRQRPKVRCQYINARTGLTIAGLETVVNAQFNS